MVRGGLFAALRCSSHTLSCVCCDPRGEYTGCSSDSLSLVCCDPRGEYTEYLDKETGTGEHGVTILLYQKNYTSPPIRYVVYSPTLCIAYTIKFLFVATDPPVTITPVDLMKYVEMLHKLVLALVMKDT